MLLDNAKKAMRKGDICWVGITVKNCAECGEDISHARRVQVKTADEYLRGLG
jgi:RNA polymerase-binding transcription factor DksA